MNENFRLGTIGGVRVGLNWSVVVIVALIALALTGDLHYVAPGFGTAAYGLVALLTAALFLASLLGHELSHAFVARRRGVSVGGIVLWALGGVAKLNGDAPDAGSELRIAIAGPLASLLFAATFGLLALGFDLVGASTLLATALWWLAEMNVALALFNLLPAYPLDGGRVLRAGLWRHWDDRLRATDAAAVVGGFLGMGLIGLGIFALLLVPALSLNGIWIAIIGWFVLRASRQQRAAVHIASSLDGLSVGDVMHPVAFVAPAYATIDNLVEKYMRPGRLDRCPLVDFNGAVAGLVSLDHLGAVPQQQWGFTKASEVSWPVTSLAQVAPFDALAPLVDRLASVPGHSALVWDEGRLVGTVTPRDVEQALHSPAVFRKRSGYAPVSGA
ncbi:MAG: site-2 protease family protein [Acidimicrobiales bacterium]